ncbi:hypothetical protein L798_12122 [Zootermopsis nevadensis]|uniref:Uncharacterized protein n=1 Tax=Zootermopsis nevadensis TaxID=136037 RepID=A0A067R6L4_ZOONE|nr:hypothetical protein L798_12122 [Zootermopsis nevadensis]
MYEVKLSRRLKLMKYSRATSRVVKTLAENLVCPPFSHCTDHCNSIYSLETNVLPFTYQREIHNTGCIVVNLFLVSHKLTDVSEAQSAYVIALMTEEVSTSETSPTFNYATGHSIPEDSPLRT